jgi:hypothetical protein
MTILFKYPLHWAIYLSVYVGVQSNHRDAVPIPQCACQGRVGGLDVIKFHSQNATGFMQLKLERYRPVLFIAQMIAKFFN